jgi:hypothetical protein
LKKRQREGREEGMGDATFYVEKEKCPVLKFPSSPSSSFR